MKSLILPTNWIFPLYFLLVFRSSNISKLKCSKNNLPRILFIFLMNLYKFTTFAACQLTLKRAHSIVLSLFLSLAALPTCIDCDGTFSPYTRTCTRMCATFVARSSSLNPPSSVICWSIKVWWHQRCSVPSAWCGWRTSTACVCIASHTTAPTPSARTAPRRAARGRHCGRTWSTRTSWPQTCSARTARRASSSSAISRSTWPFTRACSSTTARTVPRSVAPARTCMYTSSSATRTSGSRRSWPAHTIRSWSRPS